MANSKPATGNGWLTTPYNKLIEDDAQIVRVPLDNVDWGARPSVMSRARGGHSNRVAIRHIPNESKK